MGRFTVCIDEACERPSPMTVNLIPPPATWRPDLKGTALAWEWRRAAGVNKDGSTKSRNAHRHERKYILRLERFRVLQLKDKSEWTPSDHAMVDKDEHRKSKVEIQRHKNRSIPTVRRNMNLQRVVYGQKIRKENMDKVAKYIFDNNVDIDTGVTSDEDAFKYIVELMDDKTSTIGKAIFDALGMTLREGFWDGNFNGAMYALTSRGFGDVGAGQSEAVRFLVNNRSTTVLTHPDGKDFNYSQSEFKNLQTTYIPLRICNSFANCTAMESAFQLLFDFLPLGSRRLWLRSGVGRSYLALRKIDMKYIEKTGDKSPKFVFGITIIKNVSVSERTTESNGKEIVSFITGGIGTRCKVNQPINPKLICSKSQEKALETTQETLGPNYMAAEVCRKRKAEFMEDSVMRW